MVGKIKNDEPKHLLFTWFQKHLSCEPNYEISQIVGPAFKNPTFSFQATLNVKIDNISLQAIGQARSIKCARTIAAKEMIQNIENAGLFDRATKSFSNHKKSTRLKNEDANDKFCEQNSSDGNSKVKMLKSAIIAKPVDKVKKNSLTNGHADDDEVHVLDSDEDKPTTSKRKCDQIETLEENEGQARKQQKISAGSVKPTANDVNACEKLKSFDSFLRNLPQQTSAELDAELWLHYDNLKQTQQDLQDKMALMHQLNNYVSKYFGPGSGFYIYGSSITGLGSYDSDMDMCFLVPHPLFDPTSHLATVQNIDDMQRMFCVDSLKRLRKLLFGYVQRSKRLYHDRFNESMCCQAINLIMARVPILKLSNVSFLSLDIEVDINVNNTAGLRNSHLLHYYAMIDRRFGALVLAVKHWALRNDIGSSMHGTLSGLSLTLMVLHFLQRRIRNQAPILPDLQKCLPHIFHHSTQIVDLRVFDDHLLPEHIKATAKSNNLSLSGLLMEFFDYYSNQVDFSRYYISIRSNGELKERDYFVEMKLEHESKRKQSGDMQYLFVEEPFEGTNCARCVYNEANFRKIKLAFQTARESLQKYNSLRALGVDFKLRE